MHVDATGAASPEHAGLGLARGVHVPATRPFADGATSTSMRL
jgi:hypothetical protein